MRGQTGVLSERRGSYPFIDFRLLNSKYNPSFRSVFKKKKETKISLESL